MDPMSDAIGVSLIGNPIVTFSVVISSGIEWISGMKRFSSGRTTAVLMAFFGSWISCLLIHFEIWVAAAFTWPTAEETPTIEISGISAISSSPSWYSDGNSSMLREMNLRARLSVILSAGELKSQ